MPNNTQNESIIINQPQLEDIINVPPGWLLKSGMSTLGVLVLLTFCLAWFIKYPDTVEVDVVTTAQNSPLPVVLKDGGEIEYFFVQDGDTVEQNQVLFKMRSNGSMEGANQLKNWIVEAEDIPNSIPDFNETVDFSKTIDQMKTIVEEYNLFRKNQDFSKRRRIAKEEKQQLQRLNDNLKKQIAIFRQEEALISKDLDRHRQLYEEQVIAQKEWDDKNITKAQYARQLVQLENAILQNESQLIAIDKQLVEWGIEQQAQLETFRMRWPAARNTLLSDVNQWFAKTQYTAPSSGIFRALQDMTGGTFMPSQSELGYIEPIVDSNKLYISCILPMQAIKKVSVGNMVKVVLEPYPKEEFGDVELSVGQIRSLPSKDKEGNPVYEAKLFLETEHLLTNKGDTLPYQYFVTGRATIITKEKRLLERFFDKLTSKIADHL